MVLNHFLADRYTVKPMDGDDDPALHANGATWTEAAQQVLSYMGAGSIEGHTVRVTRTGSGRMVILFNAKKKNSTRLFGIMRTDGGDIAA